MNGGNDPYNPLSWAAGTPYDFLGKYFPYIAAGLALLLVIVVYVMIARAVSKGKPKRGASGGMMFTDIEMMRKKGLLNEAEYRNVKRKMSEREVAAARDKARADQAALLEQAAFGLDAARALLTPEERAIIEARKAASAKAQSGTAPERSDMPTGSDRPKESNGSDTSGTSDTSDRSDGSDGSERHFSPAETEKTDEPSGAAAAAARVRARLEARKQAQGDALAQARQKLSAPSAAQAPQPSMNMTRVAQERRRSAEDAQNAAQAGGSGAKPGELDILFAKGAISREEYDRLKGFFK